MKTLFRSLILLLLMALCPVAQAQLAASNVRPVQRSGTKLVDIDYDVTGTTLQVNVALQISADGGSNWTVPAISLTGAIGSNVTPGTNLRITWNSGADWNQQLSSQMKIRLSVTEVPAGFAIIPSGSFTMGDVADSNQNGDSSIHTVAVSAFYMAKNLVTWSEYQTVKTWAADNGYTDLAAGAGKASNHPVQTVSWWDAIKYCNARSQKEGLTPVYTVSGEVMKIGTTAPTTNWSTNGYRLPTEAEWEKAARGGLSGKRFPWGDTISQSQANYYAYSGYSYDLSGAVDNYHPTYLTGDYPYTSPVGSFSANGYGLNDMAGNVWQWCWDWYDAYDISSSVDPSGLSSGSIRVHRGGNWEYDAYSCCVSARYYNVPFFLNYNLGFRLACSSTSTLSSATTESANTTFDTRDLASTCLADTDGDGLTDIFERALVADNQASWLRVGDMIRLDFNRLGITGSVNLLGSLPIGLKFDSKTGILQGKVTGKAGKYPLKLQFISGKTVFQRISLPLSIAPFSSGLAATFQGLLEDDQGQPKGLISLKVTAPGVWTASLDFAGSSKVLAAKGGFSLDPTQESVDLTIPFSFPMTVHLHLDPNSALISGDYPQGSIRGFRIASGSELPSQAANLSVMFDQGRQDGYATPAGIGWVSGSIAKTGVITLSGQLGDAQTFNKTLNLSATGQAILWLRPYLNKSSYFGGIVSLRGSGLLANTSESSLEERLTWSRNPDCKELSYPVGFGPLPVSSLVARYTAPSSASVLAQSLGLIKRSLHLSVDGGGVPDGTSSNILPSELTLNEKFFLLADPISLVPWVGNLGKTSGRITGSLTLSASSSKGVLKGPALVSGVLFQGNTLDSGAVGVGLIKIPAAGVKGNYRTAAMTLDSGLVKVPAGVLLRPTGTVQSVEVFYMARTETTWGQWQTVRTWAIANGYDFGGVGEGNGDAFPVTNVSWYHVVKWCNARSEMEGLRPVYVVNESIYRSGDAAPDMDASANGYRLPSEAEWEFAARGGANTHNYEYSGSDNFYDVAWCYENSSFNAHEVSRKTGNELGLYDMSGNVWEWCYDWYPGYENTYRVFRGGSWNWIGYWSRMAFRSTYDYPTITYEDVGFRVVRALLR